MYAGGFNCGKKDEKKSNNIDLKDLLEKEEICDNPIYSKMFNLFTEFLNSLSQQISEVKLEISKIANNFIEMQQEINKVKEKYEKEIKTLKIKN